MTQTTALVAADSDYSQQQLDLIRRTVAADTTDDEFLLFMTVARSMGLNPLLRQIYAVMRSKKVKDPRTGQWRDTKQMTIQVGIDGYRARAADTGAFAGVDDAVYVVGDNGKPISATVTVWRMVHGQRCGFTHTAYYEEYAQLYDGKPQGQWSKPFMMLAKCAESGALRKGFPGELAGAYTAEEMPSVEEQPYVDADPAPRQLQSTGAPATLTVEPDDITYEEFQRSLPGGMNLYDALALVDIHSPDTLELVNKRETLAQIRKAYGALIQEKRQAKAAAEIQERAPDLDRVAFIEIVSKELGYSPQDAMDLLNVKSLNGLYLRDALDQLRRLHSEAATNARKIAQAIKADIVEDAPPAPEPAPAKKPAARKTASPPPPEDPTAEGDWKPVEAPEYKPVIGERTKAHFRELGVKAGLTGDAYVAEYKRVVGSKDPTSREVQMLWADHLTALAERKKAAAMAKVAPQADDFGPEEQEPSAHYAEPETLTFPEPSEAVDYDLRTLNPGRKAS